MLCDEIREFFIEELLVNGGHFSGNLGVVELTVALHYVFDIEKDKLVWDVGHQAYIHKLLTGRKAAFSSIRKWGGLSGFPNINESKYDHFGTGHSSTSISAVLGMAESAKLSGQARKHIAVIGDGSLTGGMAFEALNNLGSSASDVLVVVNDNQMGIDPNPGAMNKHLQEMGEHKDNLFHNLQIHYSGPVDGHDVIGLVKELRAQKRSNTPRVLHIKTIKGKGYLPAEREQTEWHSVKYVKIDKASKQQGIKFQQVFGQTLLQLAKEDERVVGVTPAMPSGSSMDLMMADMPARVFDVGIAEQHAVTFSAGLALDGKRPFCHIYSSFAQRAYDQIIHDVALQNIPVIFCLDRAGLVGADGPTHHGMFDIASLVAVPNLKIVSPMDLYGLKCAMHWALNQKGPVVIRYPRGYGLAKDLDKAVDLTAFESSNQLSEGEELLVLSLGAIGVEVQEALSGGLKERVTHIDVHMVKPLDQTRFPNILGQYDKLLVVEENMKEGGLYQMVSAMASAVNHSGIIESISVDDQFVEHGSVKDLRQALGMDAQSIQKKILAMLSL